MNNKKISFSGLELNVHLTHVHVISVAAIMRSFSMLQDNIVPYVPTLVGKLTEKLVIVSKVRLKSFFSGKTLNYQLSTLLMLPFFCCCCCCCCCLLEVSAAKGTGF